MKNSLQLLLAVFLLLLFNSCRTDIASATEEYSENIAQSNEKKGIIDKYTSEFNFLGSGYNVTEDFANENSARNQVIDITSLNSSFPNAAYGVPVLSQDFWTEYGENAKVFNQKITDKVDTGFSLPLFKSILKLSFNQTTTTTNKFDAKYIYGMTNLLIKQKRYQFEKPVDVLKNHLTPSFQYALVNYSPQQIVALYGTHVLSDIYTGAKLEIKYQAETTNLDRSSASAAGIKTGVKDIFNFDIDQNIDASSSFMNYNRTLSYRTRGGDPSQSLIGTINLDQNAPSINIANWQNSSNASNAVMVDIKNSGLIILYDLISDPAKKMQVKSYIDQYLIDNQVQLDWVAKPIYRYFAPTTGDHFYTRTAGSYPGWGYEGIAFMAYLYRAENTVPIYRYFNGVDHLYTQNPGAPFGYHSEGIEFYAYPTQISGTVPIYQYGNPQVGDHFYTKDFQNYYGYIYEGVAFYAK